MGTHRGDTTGTGGGAQNCRLVTSSSEVSTATTHLSSTPPRSYAFGGISFKPVGVAVVERSASFGATATITSAPQRRLHRQTALSATGAIASSATFVLDPFGFRCALGHRDDHKRSAAEASPSSRPRCHGRNRIVGDLLLDSHPLGGTHRHGADCRSAAAPPSSSGRAYRQRLDYLDGGLLLDPRAGGSTHRPGDDHLGAAAGPVALGCDRGQRSDHRRRSGRRRGGHP